MSNTQSKEMNEAKHYPKHSSQDLGQYYMNHVMAELHRLAVINAELVEAIEAEMCDEWDCHSYHPKLHAALEKAKQWG